MTTNFLFSLVLYTTLRENMHIKSLQVKMTTTIFSFFLALYLARTENLHIISSSTNIYIMKTCPKSCTSSLFGTHKKPICNFAFQIRMTTTLFPFRKSFLSGSFLPINYGLASALISCAQVRRSLVLYTSCLFSDLRESKELYRRCSIELKTWTYPSDFVKWSSNETTETKNVLHGLLSRVIITGSIDRKLHEVFT